MTDYEESYKITLHGSLLMSYCKSTSLCGSRGVIGNENGSKKK